MARLFFALRTPDELRAVLREAQQQLVELLGADAPRLEQLENSHVTLLFLGDVAEEKKSSLISSAHRSMTEARVGPIDMVLGAIEPNDRRRPTVIWVSVAPADPFVRLHNAAKAAAREVGLDIATGAFHPHLTLARFRRPARLTGVTLPTLPERTAIAADAILVESVLGQGAPKHTVIATFPL